MNSTLLPLRFVVIISTLLLSPFSQAHHAWNDYHWASASISLPIPVINSVSGDWQFPLDEALRHWSESIVLDPFISPVDNGNNVRKECPIEKGYLRVCNYDYGTTGWLGQTVIGFDWFGHIDKARARLNDSYSQYWSLEKKNHIMCHEIGHSYGLAHTRQDGGSQQSCMDLSNDPLSQWPNQHDYSQLIAIYAHQDLYASYADGKSIVAAIASAQVPDLASAILIEKNRYFESWLLYRDDGGYWLIHNYRAPAP